MKKTGIKLGKVATQIIEHSSSSLLIFTVNGKEYAFPVKSIQEIINCTGYSELPANTTSAHGVVSLRGVGVPVFDFNAMLYGAASAIGKRSCIVIVEVETAASGKKHCFGLLVDSVSVVREIEHDKVEDTPHLGEKSDNDVFSGMIQLEGQFILILNEEKLYSRLESKSSGMEKFKKASM
ncbi:MAG: chemotaxis protein CheW [Bacteriovorax sp.]